MLGFSEKGIFVSRWLRVSFRQKDVGRVVSGKGETTWAELQQREWSSRRGSRGDAEKVALAAGLRAEPTKTTEGSAHDALHHAKRFIQTFTF